MKSGGEPDGGAGGPSSTKHTICTSREKRLVLPEETNATPARVSRHHRDLTVVSFGNVRF
jgi:hypothetical protein